jgi:phospholipase/lecithinase/hemolysin
MNTGQQQPQGQSANQMQGQMQGQQSGQMQSHAEGAVARTIEQQTAKMPSDVFLWAAAGSIGASALLQMMGKNKASLFVGQWVSPFLLLGVYNKIVKVAGSDRAH